MFILVSNIANQSYDDISPYNDALRTDWFESSQNFINIIINALFE